MIDLDRLLADSEMLCNNKIRSAPVIGLTDTLSVNMFIFTLSVTDAVDPQITSLC